MRANMGSCRAAWMLFATVAAFTPQSPPETNWITSVALAGMVRNRYVGDCLPILNTYSVPGDRPVSSARKTLKSLSGYGRVTVFCDRQARTGAIRPRVVGAK